eukprot:CAMPEP_0113478220 /NCGR_PEP_ID=MMETSP0014_2-20120614/20635_1 /TAXON_ID=2857 /ORGANISM="Nitzschia sp." /LENGTH=420 /DNA_ID=CAMNT_0000371387 /DNA_START=713 /DNA_END=1972 /DNA_ORIENTATION=+ /assembly_acc=CAM_ASM_000159
MSVSELVTGPYYRWDKSAPGPLVEAFPDDFRLIASSIDQGASQGGEVGDNLFTECCDYDSNGEEVCEFWSGLNFPKRDCAFMGIGFSMPTCSNGQSDSPDHKSHMAYTTDGSVAGPCPQGYQAKRFPQIQLFIRFAYRGATKTYELSDGLMSFHFDFMNGWQTGKLQEIINGCGFDPDQEIDEYNPPCGCDEFLTPNTNVALPMCESDVRRLIIDESTSNMNSLPQGECLPSPSALIPKSWTTNPPITVVLPDQCPSPCPSPPSPTNGPAPTQPTPQPTLRPPLPTTSPPVVSPTNSPVAAPTPSGGCADSSSFFFSELNENCAWIGANDECDLEDEEDGIPLRLFCPASCNACDELNSLDCFERFEICHIGLGRACVAESWRCEAECEEQDEEDDECFEICDEELENCFWEVEDNESCW